MVKCFLCRQNRHHRNICEEKAGKSENPLKKITGAKRGKM